MTSRMKLTGVDLRRLLQAWGFDIINATVCCRVVQREKSSVGGYMT